MFELLHNCSFDTNLGFLAHYRFGKVEWSHCESSWYLYDSDARLGSDVEENVEPGRKCLDNFAVLTDLKLLEVSVVFEKRESMSLSEVRKKYLSIFAAWSPAGFKESLALAPEKAASISMLVRDLAGEADWDLANSEGGFDLCSPASLPGNNLLLCEACSLVSESVPSSVANLLYLSIRGVEA